MLAERARLAPVGLSPMKMVERNSAFDVSRWIFVGGGWIRLLDVTLAWARAVSERDAESRWLALARGRLWRENAC